MQQAKTIDKLQCMLSEVEKTLKETQDRIQWLESSRNYLDRLIIELEETNVGLKKEIMRLRSHQTDSGEPHYIDEYGTCYWFDSEGRHHRDGDRPAILHHNGTISYYDHGRLHRDGDKPAVIQPDGTIFYYIQGNAHRDGDNPAAIYSNGSICYLKDGRFHRDNNKPAIISSCGRQSWYIHGMIARTDRGPLIINSDGTMIYK